MTLAQVDKLTVRYGATVALDAIDLSIQAGEVHAVVGENGAGKSTLMRAIAGVARPVSGQITLQPRTRMAWVPQGVLLPPDLTATEWIFLAGELRSRMRTLRRRAMHVGAADALRAIGCDADAGARIHTLSVAQRKQLQLARAVRSSPDLLLLDEPTAVLGDAETQRLFGLVRSLTHTGTGVLYVSHRLDEVLAIADRVTVLRDGRRVSTDTVGDVDTATLVHRMVGRDISAHPSTNRTLGAVALGLADVSVAHVCGLSLDVHRGEVVGLAGLVGAGRSEVLEGIAGLRRVRGGRIERRDTPVLVPEDRSSKGLISTLGLRANIFLPAPSCLLRQRRERIEAQEWITRLRIRNDGTDAAIASLSGGNQQKVLLARALRHEPRLLLLDEPTAGVDVGAKAEIHALIRQLADTGTAILLASSDLPELLHLCDRIVALRAGRATGTLAATEATGSALAALITGAHP